MERLSGMDAFFLYVETPTQHMHVTLVAVLDPEGIRGGYDFERMRRHIAARVPLVPPLLRRLVPVPLRLHHPVWVIDPDFDIEHHVHRAALPSPGGDRELAELTAQIASIPLDRSRPLWELWLVEGLEGGKIALIAKLHHSSIDGVAGVEQMVNFFDLEPYPAEPVEVPAIEPEPIPSDAELLGLAAASRARSMLDIGSLVTRTVGSVLAVRRRRAVSDDLENEWGPGAGLGKGATPLVCPPSPFNGAISGQRRVAFARLSLDDIKKVKATMNATVNDVILAVCAGAIRELLDRKGVLPAEPLVAACPVNVRTEDQKGRADNRVSAMFTLLHTDIGDPLERLAATHRAARAAKDEHAMFGSDTLQSWAEIADPNVASWLSSLYSSSGIADRHRPAINVMVSNLPGPPFPLYLAGAELQRAYPMGQVIEGVGLNITVMSYRNWVDIGFMAAANLVPDVWDLADQIEPAFDELADAAAAAR